MPRLAVYMAHFANLRHECNCKRRHLFLVRATLAPSSPRLAPPFLPFLSVSSLSPFLFPLVLPMSPPPPFNATPPARVEVVTLTVTSRSSTPTSKPSSGGSSASVPIAAIVGGVAGGVTLAVLLVLVWKYWGVLIKRDERQKRKEAVRPIVAIGTVD